MRCGKRPKRRMTSACFSPIQQRDRRPVSSREAREQRDRAILIAGRLAVLERHVQERALVAIERAIARRSIDRGRAIASAPRVAGERARRVAKDVARELVEQDRRAPACRARVVSSRERAARARPRPRRRSDARISASNAGSLRNQTSRAPRAAIRPEPELENFARRAASRSAAAL